MKLLSFFLLLGLCSCLSESTPKLENTSNQSIKPGNIEFFEVYSLKEVNTEELQSRRLENLVSFAFDSIYYFVKEKDIRKVDSILASSEIKKEFPKDLEFMWSYKSETNKDSLKGRHLYAVKVPKNGFARIDGRYVHFARTELDGKYNRICIDLLMNIDGTVEWKKMTEDNLNRCIAITMDHVVLSCPKVNYSIGSGSAGIEGNFSLEEAEELVTRINRGRR